MTTLRTTTLIQKIAVAVFFAGVIPYALALIVGGLVILGALIGIAS